MADSPIVSVIIPTYNRAEVIERALDSVLAQTYQDYEIIVIDDASTDQTCAVVEAYDDPRIRLIRSHANGGAGAARNAGIVQAQGEYIAFLDSDDEWLAQKLAKQVSLMERLSEEWALCHTGVVVSKANGNSIESCRDERLAGDAYRRFIAGKFPYATPTMLIRRTSLFSVGLMRSYVVGRTLSCC